MNYMFADGFMGTRAPFFMDVVTLIVALLPLLIYGGILLARKGRYKTHAFIQNLIFLMSIIVIAYFESGVRLGGGFDAFIIGSGVSHTYASIVMVAHIIISTATLFYWVGTIFSANSEFRKKILPGSASSTHKLLALKTFLGIIFTSFSGIWVYLLLFVY
jgi:putative membrane protein